MKEGVFVRLSGFRLHVAAAALASAALVVVAYGADTARAQGNPEINVEPNPAEVEGEVTIDGEGFEEDEEVSLVLQGVLGERSLGAAITDSEGVFSVTVTLPDTAGPGSYRIRAVGSDDVAIADLRIRTPEGAPAPPAAHETSVDFHRAGPTAEIAGLAVLAAALALSGVVLVLLPVRERRA